LREIIGSFAEDETKKWDVLRSVIPEHEGGTLITAKAQGRLAWRRIGEVEGDARRAAPVTPH
jgi:hypothetical protein